MNHTVVVDNMQFIPDDLEISVGDTVTWEFKQAGHSTTSDNQDYYVDVWDSGVQPVGATFDITFYKLGNFPYHCSTMPEMVGVIRVVS